MYWALLIAFSVHLFAYFVYRVGVKVFETEQTFKAIVGVFFVMFVAGAISLHYLVPKPGKANILAIPKAWMDRSFASR